MAERVLVTGAGGFIGSHLTEALVRRGEVVRAFLRYNSRGDEGLLRFFPSEIQREVEIIWGNLCDYDSVAQAVRGCTKVYHLGAQIAIPYSYLQPLDFVQTNVLGTGHVLTACLRDGGVHRVVHTSTSEVYGTAQFVPMTEKHPLCGQSPYAASKIGADMLAESFHRSFGLPVVIVRPFNTYGPRQSARAIVPTVLIQILSGKPLELGALEPTRDLTFVSDTVIGFIAAGQAEGVIGQVFNLGNGCEISIGKLAWLAMEVVGRTVEIIQKSERTRPSGSEVMRLCADASRAHILLEWGPSVSLREGLARTADWLAAHLELYRPERYQV